MEYFEGYTIQSFINCAGETGFVINPDQSLKMAKHLLRGLACMHRHGIAHSDINDGNIMFNKKEMKIIDYGLLCTTLVYPSSDKSLSCYGDHQLLDKYKEDRKFSGELWLPSDYPFQHDINELGEIFEEILSSSDFHEKYKKDSRTAKIVELIANLTNESTTPRYMYTAQQALDILEKIPENADSLY
jgi:serine/threonine protein kinase